MPRSDHIDFHTLSRELLADARNLLSAWCPGGKVIQHEYVPLNPTRHDRKPGSFRINLHTGHWADFATSDRGGDLISLYAYLNRISQVEAAKRLGAEPSAAPTIHRAPAAPPAAPDYIQVIPAPEGKLPPNHHDFGEASNTWTYRTTADELIGYVCRYNTPDGPRDKEFSIYAYFQDHTGRHAWKWRSFDKPRPLYGLETLDDRPVILVEGEKAADAGRTLFPDHAVLAWPGGSNAVQHADFSPLEGRDVTLWPDNDEPGFKAMAQVATRLEGHASVRTVPLPSYAPPGWDLADATWTPEEAARFFREAFDATSPSAEPPIHDEHPEHGLMPDTLPVVRSTRFTCLGYDRQVFYYHCTASQQIMELTPTQHMEINLRSMAPAMFWEREYPGPKLGADYKRAAEDLMQQCYAARIFDRNRIRGRGAWFDEGRCVLNLGNRVFVAGQEYAPSDTPSRNLYEAGHPLHADLSSPLTTAEANRFYELVNMLPWERRIHARLLAGWCVCAHIGGVLTWRPHLWIIGKKGSGKSWCMNSIVKRILGENCLFALSDTSEAGIRQTLGGDSIPVMFDEAEGTDQRAIARLQSVLALVRQSSSETGGRIIKGAATGRAVQYTIRSCFAFSSINSSLMQESDRSRVSVLELNQDFNQHTFGDIAEAQVALFQNRYVERFYARSIELAAVIRANAHVFADAVAAVLGEQRAGDQLGALLAGAYSLHSSQLITIEKARQWVSEQDWQADREEVQSQSDEQNLMHFLMAQRVKFRPGVSGTFEDVPVGELVEAVNAPVENLNFPREPAREALKWSGFRVDAGCLYISNTAPDIKRMLTNTPWSTNYSRVLKRLPGAAATGPISFGHKHSLARATQIPLL